MHFASKKKDENFLLFVIGREHLIDKIFKNINYPFQLADKMVYSV